MNPRCKVRDLPEQEKPQYRAKAVGTAALNTSELLQLIGSFTYADTAGEITQRGQTLQGLVEMSVEELTGIPDVGQAAALAIKAALELGRRWVLESTPDNQTIRSPQDAAQNLMYRFGKEDQEHLVVLLLNTRHKIIATEVVYKGSVNTALVRVGEIFKEAVRCNAVAIILCHNHPGGDPSPSVEDVALTKEVVQAGRLLDIEPLDHIIVSAGRFFSLREHGLGFDSPAK